MELRWRTNNQQKIILHFGGSWKTMKELKLNLNNAKVKYFWKRGTCSSKKNHTDIHINEIKGRYTFPKLIYEHTWTTMYSEYYADLSCVFFWNYWRRGKCLKLINNEVWLFLLSDRKSINVTFAWLFTQI